MDLFIGNKKVENNGLFAYDGCHKIYVLEDNEDSFKAQELGYQILSINDLKTTYDKSCNLRFIENWKLDKTYIQQGKATDIEVK